MKAIEQYFPVVLFIMLCDVAQTFDPEDDKRLTAQQQIFVAVRFSCFHKWKFHNSAFLTDKKLRTVIINYCRYHVLLTAIYSPQRSYSKSKQRRSKCCFCGTRRTGIVQEDYEDA